MNKSESNLTFCDECEQRVFGEGETCVHCGGTFCFDHVEAHNCSENPRITIEQSGSGSNSENLIAGAIVILAGAILSLTFIGAIVGIPLAMLGFAVMFPRFAVFIGAGSILTLLLLAVSL